MRDGLTAHTLWSEANRRRFVHWTWLPPGSHRDLPVVILLHGVHEGGGFCWWQKGSADLIAAGLVATGELPPFCLVMPGDTGAEQGSGYCDWHDGTARAETYLIEELLPWIAAELPTSDALHIGGLSMGGYGAITLALRHPGVFGSASSTSGFFDPQRLFRFVPDAARRMWGGEDGMRAHDPRALLADPERRRDLRIAFDCGTEDELLDQNRDLQAQLQALGVAHGYVERPGGHEWDYWSARLEHHLRFHLARGGTSRVPRSTAPKASAGRKWRAGARRRIPALAMASQSPSPVAPAARRRRFRRLRRHPWWTAAAAALAAGLAAFVVLWFAPQALFIDTTVDEPLPAVAVVPSPATAPTASAAPRLETLSRTPFRSLEHETAGTAVLLRLPDGSMVLRLEDLDTSNGPDLRVTLSPTPPDRGDRDYGDHLDLGALKGNKGNQNYAVPAGTDLNRYRSVVIWCRRFSVGFGVAALA